MLKRNTFTLIEILIVIAIVAILAGMLFGGIAAAQKKADVAKAVTDVNALKMAIANYQMEYNKLPKKFSTAVSGELTSAQYTELISILQGDDSPTGTNPRKKKFLDVRTEKGEFCDPWDNNYHVAFGTYKDGLTTATGKPSELEGDTSNITVLIWSENDVQWVFSVPTSRTKSGNYAITQ